MHSIEREAEVIPVRTDGGLTQAGVFGSGRCKRGGEIIASSAQILDRKILCATTDRKVRGCAGQLQRFDQGAARLDQCFPMLEEGRIEGGDLPPFHRRRLEQVIP